MYVPAHNRVAGRAGGEYPKWVFGRLDWYWERLEVCHCPMLERCGGLWKAFRHLERLMWSQIEDASDHTHPVAFNNEGQSDGVQQRFEQVVHGEEPPPLWQIDIGGFDGHGPEARVFGLRSGEVFEILWYDPHHRVFPMSGPYTAVAEDVAFK